MIYAIFQNAGKSYNTGFEVLWSETISKAVSFSLNGNIYRNTIDSFSVLNLYPTPHIFSADKQSAISGNIKLNASFHLAGNVDLQATIVYLAPDVIPQGKIEQRFSVDVGANKMIQKGKGEVFANATDLFNTMVIDKRIQGNGFYYVSADYYETQAIRIGYSYKF